MTDATGCVVFKVLASASTCDLTFSRPCVGFGMFAFCSPCPYAARCPVPVASDDADLIPELIFSWHADDGRLSWCDRNHGHGQSAHAHQAPCCGPGQPRVAFQLARRGGLRATADLSKRTIVAARGPHVWRHGSRPSPSAHAGQDLNARGRDAGPAGIKRQSCGNKGTALRE